jgi:lipoprotein-anchoring transpeptidase ErfK/SrfK
LSTVAAEPSLRRTEQRTQGENVPEEKRGLWADRKRRTAVLGASSAIVVIAAVIIGFIAFRSGANDDRPTVGKKQAPATAAGTTTTTLPPGVSLVAQATGPQLAVYPAPDAPAPSMTFENPWLLNGEAGKEVPQVFLVEEQRPDGWVRVLLPERPNGSSGWIRPTDVKLTPNPYRIEVNVGEHKIKVFERNEVRYEGDVATGKPSTPTPTGKYYTRVLIQAINPNEVYGPFAYGLSGHSEVLTEFNGGDGETGVHGNNDKSVLGKSVTAGCIRMDNEEITRLSKILPLGTPVEIVS